VIAPAASRKAINNSDMEARVKSELVIEKRLHIDGRGLLVRWSEGGGRSAYPHHLPATASTPAAADAALSARVIHFGRKSMIAGGGD
jgi:hypothetical protein